MSQLSNWAVGLISNWWRPRQVGGTWFYPMNNDPWSTQDFLKNFSDIPELNAVINAKANAFSAGCIKKVNEKGEILDADEVVKLLTNPNWFQAEKEFLRQTKMFREIFGNEYLYAYFGVGYKPINAKALFTLPPNLVTSEYDSTEPFFMQSEMPAEVKYIYKLVKETKIEPEQLIHLNDNRVNITDKTRKEFLKGESKQVPLRPALNNLRMAYETRGVILKRRGALGILSNAASDVAGQIPLFKKERDQLQKQYSQYGGLDSQDNLIITSANLKWQQMTVSPDKLGLFDETREDFLKVCDGYSVPPEIFGSTKDKTYENQNQARKGMYDNTIIPEANEWIGALNKFFYGVDSKDKLIMDYSHLSIFQEDLEKTAKSLESIVKALSQALLDKAIDVKVYQQELNKYGIAIAS